MCHCRLVNCQNGVCLANFCVYFMYLLEVNVAKKTVKKLSAGRGRLDKPGARKASGKKVVKKKRVVKCEVCGRAIPAVRLELLPDTTFCVKCSAEHAPIRVYDPEEICAKPSLSCANGFAPSD